MPATEILNDWRSGTWICISPGGTPLGCQVQRWKVCELPGWWQSPATQRWPENHSPGPSRQNCHSKTCDQLESKSVHLLIPVFHDSSLLLWGWIMHVLLSQSVHREQNLSQRPAKLWRSSYPANTCISCTSIRTGNAHFWQKHSLCF